MEKRIRTVKLARSQWKARSIIKQFRPQVAVGVGGYASGPTLKTAGMMGVPTLIQEQNSYAGVTNKLLAQKARKICVAYDGMEKFFPADKIIMTGKSRSPESDEGHTFKEAALHSFNLQPDKKTILIVGGSLGARTINNTLTTGLSIKENRCPVYLANREILLSASNGSRKSGGRKPEFICDGLHQGYGSSLCGFRPSNLTCREPVLFPSSVFCTSR